MPAPPAPARPVPDEAPAPRHRRFVYAFLAVLLVTSAVGVEAWPLTGWRLFSQVRTERVASWAVVAVDMAGRETPLDVASLGRPYRGVSWVLGDFAVMTPAERDAVCRAWVAAAAERRLVPPSASLRIYRRVHLVPEAMPTPRTLRYKCGGPP